MSERDAPSLFSHCAARQQDDVAYAAVETTRAAGAARVDAAALAKRAAVDHIMVQRGLGQPAWAGGGGRAAAGAARAARAHARR